jgi:branched-chain amino acid transport system substrate-binding protein
LQRRWMAACGCLVVGLGTGVAACGGDSGGGGSSSSSGGGGKTVTIYSSLPLQGASRVNSEAVNNGAKMALKAVNNKVNGYTIDFKTLDDSTASAGKWDPGQTQANARKAVQDKSTIAYLGEFNSGATANSLPILNQAAIPQVSPSNTGVGLTTDEPGADVGEPTKYYPAGTRTYARVVPRDTIQGAAVTEAMTEDGCKSVFIVNDKEVYGQGLSKVVEKDAPGAGIKVAGNDGYDPKASNYRSLASKIKGTGADCFFGSIIVDNNGVQLYKDIYAGVPGVKMYGPDGVAEVTFTDPKQGGLPADVAGHVKITVATLSQENYPPEGKKFFDDYQSTYNKKPETYAIYGYESMSLILDAMKRAGDKANDKKAVNDAIHSTKDKKSVLGTYSIDKNGDTSLTDYGLYSVKNGELTFDKVIKAQTT